MNEAVNQIAFADIILLNKIDLVSEEELQHARRLVRSINVTADLVECQLNSGAAGEEGSGAAGPAPAARLPAWDRLMGINSFSIERALQVRACGGGSVWALGVCVRVGGGGGWGGGCRLPRATASPRPHPSRPR